MPPRAIRRYPSLKSSWTANAYEAGLHPCAAPSGLEVDAEAFPFGEELLRIAECQHLAFDEGRFGYRSFCIQFGPVVEDDVVHGDAPVEPTCVEVDDLLDRVRRLRLTVITERAAIAEREHAFRQAEELMHAKAVEAMALG